MNSLLLKLLTRLNALPRRSHLDENTITRDAHGLIPEQNPYHTNSNSSPLHADDLSCFIKTSLSVEGQVGIALSRDITIDDLQNLETEAHGQLVTDLA